MPFYQKINKFADTFYIAVRRLLLLEIGFKTDETLEDDYSILQSDYKAIEYKELVSLNSFEKKRNNCFYLLHHPVWKNNEKNGKMRVVFGALFSIKDKHNTNLIAAIGPNTQKTIFEIVLSFRKRLFSLTADI
jgi:hypothetical protein